MPVMIEARNKFPDSRKTTLGNSRRVVVARRLLALVLRARPGRLPALADSSDIWSNLQIIFPIIYIIDLTHYNRPSLDTISIKSLSMKLRRTPTCFAFCSRVCHVERPLVAKCKYWSAHSSQWCTLLSPRYHCSKRAIDSLHNSPDWIGGLDGRPARNQNSAGLVTADVDGPMPDINASRARGRFESRSRGPARTSNIVSR
jgi:hypothetical protein